MGADSVADSVASCMAAGAIAEALRQKPAYLETANPTTQVGRGPTRQPTQLCPGAIAGAGAGAFLVETLGKCKPLIQANTGRGHLAADSVALRFDCRGCRRGLLVETLGKVANPISV